jgi:hypothetical protein
LGFAFPIRPSDHNHGRQQRGIPAFGDETFEDGIWDKIWEWEFNVYSMYMIQKINFVGVLFGKFPKHLSPSVPFPNVGMPKKL